MAINLNKLKKSTTVATVITIAACLVPESAQAIILRFSGTPAATPRIDIFEFDINLNVSESNNNEGFFSGAITKFRGQFVGGEPENIIFLPLSFSSGNLTASVLSQSELESDLTNFGDPRITFINLVEDPFNPNANNFNNGAVRYEATSEQSPVTLTLFVPCPDQQSTCQTWANSLSTLQQFPLIPAVVQIPNPINGGNFIQPFGFQQNSGLSLNEVIPAPDATEIPEPNAIASLLGFGALGVASLLKYNKGSSKLP